MAAAREKKAGWCLLSRMCFWGQRTRARAPRVASHELCMVVSSRRKGVPGVVGMEEGKSLQAAAPYHRVKKSEGSSALTLSFLSPHEERNKTEPMAPSATRAGLRGLAAGWAAVARQGGGEFVWWRAVATAIDGVQQKKKSPLPQARRPVAHPPSTDQHARTTRPRPHGAAEGPAALTLAPLLTSFSPSTPCLYFPVASSARSYATHDLLPQPALQGLSPYRGGGGGRSSVSAAGENCGREKKKARRRAPMQWVRTTDQHPSPSLSPHLSSFLSTPA